MPQESPQKLHNATALDHPPAIVAVSGGMDSLLALAMLAARGRALAAAWGRLLPETRDSGARDFLAEVCSRLGVPLLEIDLRQAFDAQVQEPFIKSYLQGRTPNPCALCNPRIKFGLLFQHAAKRLQRPNAPLATGHYAALCRHPRFGHMLARASDPAKDQSYFLSLLPASLLPRLVFPLSGLDKKDVPGMLEDMGLPLPGTRESQEICFIPKDDYRSYIAAQARARGLQLPGPGPVLLPDGREIGRHQGLWRYTQGQRRGLGIPWEHPLYVLGKDMKANALHVGGAEARRSRGCRLEQVNLFAPVHEWPDTVLARLRYRQQPRLVHVAPHAGGLELRFAEPDAEAADGPPAPGQLGVCYSEDGLVLAGGIIAGALPAATAPGATHA